MLASRNLALVAVVLAAVGTTRSAPADTITTTIQADPSNPAYVDYVWTLNTNGDPHGAIASIHITGPGITYNFKPTDIAILQNEQNQGWTFVGNASTGDYSFQTPSNVATGGSFTFGLRFPKSAIDTVNNPNGIPAISASTDYFDGSGGRGTTPVTTPPPPTPLTPGNSAFVPMVASVPEPNAILLGVLGLAIVGGCRLTKPHGKPIGGACAG